MRIVLMSDVYRPVINGVVNHVALLKKWLANLGQQVCLLAPGAPHPDDEADVIRYAGMPLGKSGYAVGAPLSQRAQEALHSADIVHTHHPIVSGLSATWFARQTGVPLVFTNHTRYDLYTNEYLPFIPKEFTQQAVAAYYRPFTKRCSALIAPSEGAAAVMRAWGAASPIHVIPNGVEVERFRAPLRLMTRSDIGIPERAVVGVFVGRMSREKSIDYLLKLFHMVTQESVRGHLLLVGDGPEMDDYRSLAQDLGISERVTFTGRVSYEQMPDYLALSNFFVSASVTEVHPLTVIEAMAAGLPVLGIDSPGIADTVDDGRSGLLAAPGDDADFVHKFLTLIRNAELRQELRQGAMTASERYSAQANAQAILRLYQELLRR
jgi:glycosyltransferase involved in cell wall biosynthesis